MSAREREVLAGQFGAALEMLERAIGACPDERWGGPGEWQAFWYLASHALWWTDYYLAGDPDGFRPPPPFGMEEMDPEGKLPPRVYTRPELLAHLAHVRAHLAAVLDDLTPERAAAPCGYPRKDFTMYELHLYNLRHVQHHVGQLQLLLRQGGVEPPRWVGRGTG